ncbi:hypothetical protein BOTCAL_0084g00120 [Botryotinia calthae]|uniref:Uncharacterized protein n=1 Tax=Botryotinia calthae TaxID=38488 RepID=A0A4Y8DA08_9HELO|nr:hypothetical protein BOTCAL_0084g00120 [Botryotinia calthae]
MASPTQLLSRYPHIVHYAHKILTSFSLILSLNSTYQVCAMKKRTKKNEEEIGNMSSTIDSMRGYMYGTALGPGLYRWSGVNKITIFEVMGHEQEKDEESSEEGELGNIGRRETTWQQRMGELSLGARVKKNRKGEGGKKSEQDAAAMGPIHEGSVPGPTAIKIAEVSSKVSGGSDNARIQGGDQEDGKMRIEDRSNEVTRDVESVD